MSADEPDEALVQQLIALCRETFGTEIGAKDRLVDTLSSIELINFLLAIEAEVRDVDISEFVGSDLETINRLAAKIARRRARQ